MHHERERNGRSISAFETYLRKGIRPQARGTDAGVEVKFNPWHDPDDGRFTFKGQGTRHGDQADRPRQRTWSGGGFSGGGGATAPGWTNPPKTKRLQPRPTVSAKPRGDSSGWGGGGFQGGGGGIFGGGGASGNWGENPASIRSKRPQPTVSPTVDRQTAQTPANEDATRSVQQTQDQSQIVEKNGYRFQIDASNRTRRVNGRLSTEVAPRSRLNQRRAGGSDRRPTDDGGHYVAARFNGPSDAFNHFAQDSNFNRGRYRTIENDWASDLQAGQRVQVNIVPHYRSSSQRPYEIDVSWTVNGRQRSQKIPNERSK